MPEQIIVSESERLLIEARIQEDYQSAISDHDARMERHADAYERWRVIYEPQEGEDKNKSNFRVPLVKWHTTAKLSKEIEALFGDDAEIVAEPTGPSDTKTAKKVALYMTWRLFRSMPNFVNRFIKFATYKILFGRAIAYCPWRRDTYTIPTTSRLKQLIYQLTGGLLGEELTEVVDYEGPDFQPQWPDDIIVPAEDVDDLQEFTFLIRRYKETSNGFFEGLEDGIYQDNTGEEGFKQMVLDAIVNNPERDTDVPVKDMNDEGEGVNKRTGLSIRDGLEIHEWYGRWRFLREGIEEGDENDLSVREEREVEVIGRYCPTLNRLVGFQSLEEMYPLQKKRRPFITAAMPGESFWPAGFGEMLGEIEEELTVTNNLSVEAGQFSVGPIIFYRPATGFQPQRRKYEPAEMIPLDNPKDDVNVVTTSASLQWVQAYVQFLMSLAERLGVSDLNLGRTQDRPNAPKTVGQTVALLDESNVRFALDNRVFREDFTAMLGHFWQLEVQFLPPKAFFRVTEEMANNLFPVQDGQAFLEVNDRFGRYDFQIKLATSAVNKEVGRQRALEMFSLDLQNPLIASNPYALWHATNRMHVAMGDDHFGELIPQPPEPDQSIQPSKELNRIMQNEEVNVTPLDNDQQHIAEHQRQIQWLAAQQPRDNRTMIILEEHIRAHVDQMHQKMLLEQLARKLAENVDHAVQNGASLTELLGQGQADGESTSKDGGNRSESRSGDA